MRLVREWKGPTVRDVLAAHDSAVEPLPGRVHAVAERVRAGDHAGAERRLDEALASLLPGPGSRAAPRRARRVAWFALALALLLALAAVLGWTLH